MQEKHNISWKSYSDHLPKMLKEMMTKEAFTDVTLICDDKKRIKAHRNILAACSPVFKTIFESSDASHPVIFLKGIKHSEMDSILHFIYLGETTFHQDSLNELIIASRSLEIPEFGNSPVDDPDIKIHCESQTILTQDVQRQVDTEEEENEHDYQDIAIKLESETNLTQDVQQHDDTEEYDDPLCASNFEDSKQGPQENLLHGTSLKNIKRDPRFKCNDCGKGYSNRSHLRRHTQAVHEGIKYRCQTCGVEFNQFTNLTRHLSKGICVKSSSFSE